MRLLVCGGRYYEDRCRLEHILYAIDQRLTITVIIEGGATGADRLARDWANKNGVTVETYEADWESYKGMAGRIRNSRMLSQGLPDAVLAFPGGKGTENMIMQSNLRKKKVWIVK